MHAQALVEASGQSQANVSKHLLLMARSGLLHRRKKGRLLRDQGPDPSEPAPARLHLDPRDPAGRQVATVKA